VEGALGASPLLSLPNARISSQIHHIVLAERSSYPDEKDLLDGMELSAAGQLFFVGLDKTLISAARDVVLLSIDDVDRTLGTVRLNQGENRLFFLMPEREGNYSEPEFIISGDELNHDVQVEFLEHPKLGALRVRLLAVRITSPQSINERRSATLSMHFCNMVYEWPITTF
jgi:hypothetical protein